MPLANPLVNGRAAGVTPPAGTPADAYPGGNTVPVTATGVQPPLTGDHNTAAQVGVVVLVALGVVILLQQAGFRFVVDAGIGGR